MVWWSGSQVKPEPTDFPKKYRHLLGIWEFVDEWAAQNPKFQIRCRGARFGDTWWNIAWRVSMDKYIPGRHWELDPLVDKININYI